MFVTKALAVGPDDRKLYLAVDEKAKVGLSIKRKEKQNNTCNEQEHAVRFSKQLYTQTLRPQAIARFQQYKAGMMYKP